MGGAQKYSSHLYPPLMSSKDPVGALLNEHSLGPRGLTDGCFVKLGITTVGHLASLTQLQARNLPLGAGKVNKIIAALIKYHETTTAEQTTMDHTTADLTTVDQATEHQGRDENEIKEVELFEQEINALKEMEQEYDSMMEKARLLRTKILNKQRNLLKRKLEHCPSGHCPAKRMKL
uniref:Uncharacterized protein n=1 Tax=Cacopsylla melanoneura TaxID=428564 RepID=A0A8D8U3I1_9HEMI